jgi:hypothetical protein
MALMRGFVAATLVVLATFAGPMASVQPPLSWTCPMHPEIVDTAKGACPICKMELVPVRLDSVFSCPVHSIVTESSPGKCPICRRDLVPVTVAVTWTCGAAAQDSLDPGKCPDGSARTIKYTLRAHGNHNPQHGGLFFMAGDNWHHLEGTYPEQGLFRLYLYDDYTRPLGTEKVAETSGRIVTREQFDPTTRTARELAVFPLKAVPGAHYLEAKIDPLDVPAQVIAKVKFEEQGQEYRFDFSFPAFTRETTIDASALTATGIDPSQIPVEVPDKPEDVMTQLRVRRTQIQTIVERGTFGDLYIPALQAKDLALALDVHARTLPQADRARAGRAIKQVVLAAWRLDSFGDQGDRQQIAQAFATFSDAVGQLDGLFTSKPR